MAEEKARYTTPEGYEVYCGFDEMLSIDKFKPHPNNPNTHPMEQLEVLAEVFKNNGIRQPIKISTLSGYIISGHGRLAAAKKAGLSVYPAEYQNYTDEKQEMADLLGDNKIAELSEFNTELFKQAVENAGLEDLDLSAVGFSVDEINSLFEDKEDLDNVLADELPPEEEVETRAKRGDIWLLGNHRLMCGDSTSITDVEKLMNGQKADLLVTDPPYNVAYSGGVNSKRKKIANDDMSSDDFKNFLIKVFNSANCSIKSGAPFYVWHASCEDMNFKAALMANGLSVRQTLIWVKNQLILGRQDYQWKHEPCLYGWKDGAAHYFIDDRKQTSVFEDETPDYKSMKKEDLIKLLDEIFSEKISTTIIYENKPNRSEEHPTMKPVKLIARQIKNSSRLKEKVLDLFGGSGTTLIACEQLDRCCYTMELDEHYCDVIIQRWENLTGRKAELYQE